MLGGIAGDIIASRFVGTKGAVGDFSLLSNDCHFTGTTVMLVGTAKGILEARKKNFKKIDKKTIEWTRSFYRQYPERGYEALLEKWLATNDVQPPYDGGGLESSVRAALCGWVGKNAEQTRVLARRVAKVTHNYSLAMRDAEVIAIAVFMAREGERLSKIRDYLTDYYRLSHKTLHHLRDVAREHRDYQPGLRISLQAFFESSDFEDAVRKSLWVGGDVCNLSALTGMIAGAYYGVPSQLYAQILMRLDKTIVEVLTEFERAFVPFTGD